MITIGPTLLPATIAPSLQAAALRMTGTEFNAMTEQVRGHLLTSNAEELKSLQAGRKIEASREVWWQIALGRASIFDEAIPAKMFGAIAAMPSVQEAKAELEVFLNTAALQSLRRDQRRSAAAFFRYHPDPRVVEPLLQALNDEDWRVRYTAEQALEQIREKQST